jgi:hypothetical protein
MNITTITRTTSHIDYAKTSDTNNRDLTNLDDLDCNLLNEDPQGHHTFQANPEMTKVILSFLAAL